MRVLAIDTALASCSAAVFDTAHGGVVASESVPMVRGHAEALMPLVARVMHTSALSFRDLDRIVVTTGPGSFTGMRVGIAAARGFGVATKIPVIGVSTLSAYAAPYLGADDTSPVIAAIDARHGHVYLQVFAPGGRTLVAPRIAPLSDAVRAAANTASYITGSAATVVADALPASAPKPVAIDARDAPDIAWIAQIGAVVPEGQSPPKPQYLRAPDAQPQNASQLPRR
ncbi:MAG TPA: tRNA (adenosine(37)-N6)-threonylcarbamoyltransferase complex dimerization subunit type 1 TsaB [Xanthobacteraceae bacterium]|jgi:tRNA threonylcarbamoyladenosine biosynthesis protein TsaB|nr:tRNA (adenosine(37)-N6)-threonylcarbamoyltransferase complex dimerization subunit type 1 TsaB [Xanthobacteraceae bacterium]